MSFGKAKRFDYKIKDNFPSPADYNVNTTLSERSFSINKSERFPHERMGQDKSYHSSTASVFDASQQSHRAGHRRNFSLAGPNRAVSNETVLRHNCSDQEKMRKYYRDNQRNRLSNNNSTLVYSDDGYIYDNYDSFVTQNTDEDFARFEREFRRHITNKTIVNTFDKDSLESSWQYRPEDKEEAEANANAGEDAAADDGNRKRPLKEALPLRQPLFSRRNQLRASSLQHNIISNMERFYNEFHYEKMDLIKRVKHSFELLMNDFYADCEKTFYDLHKRTTLSMLEYVSNLDYASQLNSSSSPAGHRHLDLGQEIRKTNRNMSDHHDTVKRVLLQQDSLIKHLQEKVEQLSSDRQKSEKDEQFQV